MITAAKQSAFWVEFNEDSEHWSMFFDLDI